MVGNWGVVGRIMGSFFILYFYVLFLDEFMENKFLKF